MEQEILVKILNLTEETNANVKTLQKDVVELKERVTALEERVDKLEKHIVNMKDVLLHDKILFKNLETAMNKLNLKMIIET